MAVEQTVTFTSAELLSFSRDKKKGTLLNDAASGRWVPTHGMFGTPEYEAWRAMMKRCYLRSNRSYPNYGGRGITVCQRWGDFAKFYEDMGARPSIDHSAAEARQAMIEIVVLGLPAPQGSKRYLGTSKAGHGILVESSKAVKPWREAVKWAALVHAEDHPIRGPVAVEMTFTLPKPKSAPRNRKTYPDRKPDLSKLVRST